MVNKSKTRDPRFWAKWEASGAVSDISSAHRKEIMNSPAKDYYHANEGSGDFVWVEPSYQLQGKEGVHPYTLRRFERTVPYQGCEVLVVHSQKVDSTGALDYVVVPGFVQKRAGFISKVVPITQERDRIEVTKLIRAETRGNICFWDNLDYGEPRYSGLNPMPHKDFRKLIKQFIKERGAKPAQVGRLQ